MLIAESYGGKDEPVDTLTNNFIGAGVEPALDPFRVRQVPDEATYQVSSAKPGFVPLQAFCRCSNYQAHCNLPGEDTNVLSNPNCLPIARGSCSHTGRHYTSSLSATRKPIHRTLTQRPILASAGLHVKIRKSTHGACAQFWTMMLWFT